MTSSARVLQLVEALHESPIKISLHICGAGVGALAALTQVTGCSRTLIAGDVLYDPLTATAALDYTPQHFVSKITAQHLAQHAYHTSVRLLSERFLHEQEGPHQQGAVGVQTPPVVVLGVGATSAVQTSRQRKGVDQAFVSVWGGTLKTNDVLHSRDEDRTSRKPAAALQMTPLRVQRIVDAHVVLPADMTRQQQDEQVALLILHVVGQYAANHEMEEEAAEGLVSNLPNNSSNSRHRRRVWRLDSDEADEKENGLLCVKPTLQFTSLPDVSEATLAVQSVLDGQSRYALFNRFGEARAECPPCLSPEWDEAKEGGEEAATSRHERNESSRPVRLLYPGSFRPLHWGHTELARTALLVVQERQGTQSLVTGATVTYELAAKIVDKGAVSAEELVARVGQFTKRGKRVVVTGATLFVEKAKLFPHHGLIVGIDTARRILDPKYYEGGDEAGMVRALLRDIGGRGCYFVVGGRAVASSQEGGPTAAATTTWEDMRSLSVPEALKELFISVPEERFRVDISSTELRARQKNFTL